jgi:hypothetical protein
MTNMIAHLVCHIDKKNAIKWERREWIIIYASCLWLSWNIFKTWRWFIYINIAKNYQCKLIEDTKGCVDHDGDWRRINKSLATMNHISKKSKRKFWRRGTRCDGEGQVNVWVQDINHAIKSHIALSVDIYWIKKSRWHEQEEEYWLYKSKKSIVTSSRQVAQVNIMLIPSSLGKDEKRLKEESSWQAQAYSYVFYSSLEYRSPTIKGDVTWWSWQNQSAQNPDRFQEWWKETKL